jgi:hypothetical protein
MSVLYTKNGVPIAVHGDRVYDPAGRNFGYLRADKLFGLDGRYRGTVIGDRLVYRASQSAGVSSPRAASAGRGGSSRARRSGSAISGEEPNIEP